MQKLIYLCAALSVLGVLLVYLFSPDSSYKSASVAEIARNCAGTFETTGRIVSYTISRKGNYIAGLSDSNRTVLMVLKQNGNFVGDDVRVRGRASWSSKTCWLFPDEVTLL